MKSTIALILALTLLGNSPAGVYASGMTTHAIAADHTIGKLDSDELRAILQSSNQMFQLGAFWPDAIQHKLKGDDHKDDDNISHGRWSSDPRSWNQQLLKQVAVLCKGYPADAANKVGCEASVAFYSGMLSHMIVDGPWHGTYIKKTTSDQCPAPLKGEGFTSEAYGMRHAIADGYVDYCLATRSMGINQNIPYDAEYVSAKKDGAPQYTCGGGAFGDPRQGGECWQCPSGSNRTLFPITTAETANKPGGGGAVPSYNACLKPAYTDYSSTTKHRKNKRVGEGCPKHQFWDVKGGHGLLGACYSCPSGYSRTAHPVDHSNACKKHVDAEYKPAAFLRSVYSFCSQYGSTSHLVRNGVVGECWSCPSGTVGNPLQIISGKPEQACSKLHSLPCNQLKFPNDLVPKRPVILPNVGEAVIGGMLEAAYSLERNLMPTWTDNEGKTQTISTDYLNASYAMGALNSMISLYAGEPVVPAVGSQLTIHTTERIAGADATSALESIEIKDYAEKCDWIYENAFTGKGGLGDGVHDTVELLNALWPALKAGQDVQVLRTDWIKYSLIVNGKTTVQTRDKIE